MAEYPNSIYAPRDVEEMPDVVFDADKKTTCFAQDKIDSDAEIVAIETELGTNPKGDFASVAERLDAGSSIYIPYHYKIPLADTTNGLISGVGIMGDITLGTTYSTNGCSRNLNIALTNNDKNVAWVGTVTVSFLDQHGASKSEVLSYNITPQTSLTATTLSCITTITGIAIAKISGNYPLILNAGYGAKVGLVNYPFLSTASLVHYCKIGSSVSVPAFDKTYGTLNLGSIAVNDEWEFWVYSG